MLSVQSSRLLRMAPVLQRQPLVVMELTDANGKKIFDHFNLPWCGMPSLLTVHLCSDSPRLHCKMSVKKRIFQKSTLPMPFSTQRVHRSTRTFLQMHTQDGGRPSVAVEFESGDGPHVVM